MNRRRRPLPRSAKGRTCSREASLWWAAPRARSSARRSAQTPASKRRRRAVNQTALGVSCHSGGIIMARHRSVRHILQLIISVLLGRHVQKVHGTRVSETDRKLGQQYRFPVHEDVHIAESSLQLQRTAPAAILAFFQRPAGTAWQTDRQAGCLRRVQTKTRPSVLFEKYPILRWDQLKCRSLLKTGILPHLQRPPFVKPG